MHNYSQPTHIVIITYVEICIHSYIHIHTYIGMCDNKYACAYINVCKYRVNIPVHHKLYISLVIVKMTMTMLMFNCSFLSRLVPESNKIWYIGRKRTYLRFLKVLLVLLIIQLKNYQLNNHY